MTALKPISITCLSPEDLDDMGFDSGQITEAEFERLARKMSDNYVEHYFWHDLTDIAAILDLPRL